MCSIPPPRHLSHATSVFCHVLVQLSVFACLSLFSVCFIKNDPLFIWNVFFFCVTFVGGAREDRADDSGTFDLIEIFLSPFKRKIKLGNVDFSESKQTNNLSPSLIWLLSWFPAKYPSPDVFRSWIMRSEYCDFGGEQRYNLPQTVTEA